MAGRKTIAGLYVHISTHQKGPRELPHSPPKIICVMRCKSRAENGTRTRDPQLGKLMLYQLSYFRNGYRTTYGNPLRGDNGSRTHDLLHAMQAL